MRTQDGQVQQTTVSDRSTPGQLRVTTSIGETPTTTLTREATTGGERAVSVHFEPPMTEPWVTCQADADCTVYVDHCDCDTPFFVNRRFAAQLQQWRKQGCARARPCPDVLQRGAGLPQCVQRLCTGQ